MQYYRIGIALLAAVILVGIMTVWLYEGRVAASAEPHADETQPVPQEAHKTEGDQENEPGHEGAAHSEDDGHNRGSKGAMCGEHGVPEAECKICNAGPSQGEEANIAVISDEQLKANNVQVAEAGPGEIAIQLALPGEVRLNSDRVAHVVPRVAGVVREALATVGDEVKTGQVMAVLESRELATIKAEYLSAIERESLAKATFEREKDLWKKKISAEQDYLSAKQAAAEAAISVRSAEQQLHAVGFSEEYLKGIPGQSHVSYTQYGITAPFDGSVIEKHIALGESLKDDAVCFTIADLTTVWVHLSVYQRDIPSIRKGQQVLVSAGGSPSDGVAATVDYVGPVVGEETRTAIARVVLPNEAGQWRPGQFVTGFVSTKTTKTVPVVVRKTALQTFEGSTCVFVQTDKGFVPAPVTVGSSNDTHVEIVKGLEQGTRIVVEGAFVIKAEIAKGVMEGKTCGGH
ncbi:MAG: efflux RND transporter periplasmic adaptor subunit [Candidatus Hydrogenedentes bacterium]|nr:efflux RND transporter periplasmic adaptor subunit [Candidatus Hydrogenedentota bacterium]